MHFPHYGSCCSESIFSSRVGVKRDWQALCEQAPTGVQHNCAVYFSSRSKPGQHGLTRGLQPYLRYNMHGDSSRKVIATYVNCGKISMRQRLIVDW